ncbi:MAG TPA: rRNA maturation RNase YbeY [Chitinophagaceae bacterium]|jgi:probable rRNA maturation factor|nr:rRNA maturation RNase YbeY [Chitinophagaceae bacterium]
MIKKNALIQFHFQAASALPARRALKTYITSIFKKEKQPLGSVNIVFCDDQYLLNLNRQFLQHDFYTDILSFPLSGPGEPLIADIYISTDRVRENAKSNQTSFQKELHRVIFHGILHFCGYKDKSPADIKKMRAMEDHFLEAYFRTKA